MVSIIVTVRFRADLVRVCLDSLFQYTPEEFELILVHEGDEPGMAELLNSYESKELVHHPEPKGYVGATNAGVEHVSPGASYIMLLNSDTVCTPGWLTEMLKAYELHPKAGLVVPTLPEAMGMQSMGVLTDEFYTDVEGTERLKGVCMLFSRALFDDLLANTKEHEVIGDSLLDERFDLGGGDDNDICMRTKLLGYKQIIARKSFIYHYSSASFRELFQHDTDYSKKYASGVFHKYKEKWKKKGEGDFKPSVYVAVPTVGSSIRPGLVKCLIYWSHDGTIQTNMPPTNLGGPEIPEAVFPLDNARNQVVKDFLEQQYDYLWWIDDDIVPPPNAMRKMVEILEKNDHIDAIGATCFSMKHDGGQYFPYPVTLRFNEDRKYEVYYGSGVEEVDATGGACVMVKRRVYEAVERPYEFLYHKDGTLELTCDFLVWQKAKGAGFNLYVDFDLLCDHQRICSIKGFQDLLGNVVAKASSGQ